MTPEAARKQLWYRGNLSWKLHSGQLLVYEKLRALPQSVREAVVLIARRWGKSFLGVVMALEDCLAASERQVFIVGPDLKQTRKIITPLINQICADAPAGLIRQTKSELLWKVGNSNLMIGAFDTAFESFRGLGGYGIYLEESGSSNPEEYDYVQVSVFNPVLQHSRGRKVHFTTPSKLLDHPLHTKTIPEADQNHALYIFSIMDNPLLTDEQKADEIKNMGGMEAVACKRELFCKIEKDLESTVIPEFDEERHVKEMEIPQFAHWLTVTDYGGVMDPHDSLLCYWDFLRAKFCIYDERWLPKNTDTGEVIKASLEMEKQAKWLDEPRRISDCPGQVLVDLRKMGYRTINPDKEKGSWEAMINAIRLGFQDDVIEVNPRCTKLIACLNYGQYTMNRKDFARTEALGHLDPIAALGYGYRHKNISNPFPKYLGKSKISHYIDPKDLETKSSLNSAFTPKFKG